jgi:hypothetical protein
MKHITAMGPVPGSGRWARIVAFGAVAVVAMLLSPVVSHAQSAPAAPPAKSVDMAVPTTKILAIGRFTAKATPQVWKPYLLSEVRQTAQLYLAGKIDQWYVMPDQSGVVFIFGLSDAAQVKSLLANLPMGKAGLMEFQLIPLGPLSPLRVLLSAPPPGS